MLRVNGLLVAIAVLVLIGACQGQASAGMQVLKSGDNYKVLAQAKTDPASGKGTLEVVIEPTSGWKMDKEKGPAGFTLDPPDAAKFEKKKWKKTDAKWEAKGKRIRFKVPYELGEKGEHALKIKFRFVICTDKLCQMKRFEISHPITRS